MASDRRTAIVAAGLLLASALAVGSVVADRPTAAAAVQPEDPRSPDRTTRGSDSGATAASDPTATPDPGPTEIRSCAAIDEAGTYVLAADIENADEKSCLRIRASDVRVRGAGHRIDGPPALSATEGVSIAGANTSNVTVRNLTVTEWVYGVRVEGVSNVTVRGTTVADAVSAIRVDRSRDVTVDRARTANNYEGSRRFAPPTSGSRARPPRGANWRACTSSTPGASPCARSRRPTAGTASRS